MNAITNPEALAHFCRPFAEWAREILSAPDHEAVRSVIYDAWLDPQLKETDRESLVKSAAKKMGVSLATLKKEIKAEFPPSSDDGKPDDLFFARQTIERFGEDSLIFAQGEFWAWRKQGVWEVLDDFEIAQTAQKVLDGKTAVSASMVNSVVRLTKNQLFKRGTRFDQPADRRINCLNGTLEYVDGAWSLRQHCREDWLTAQIPHAYDPQALCPRFDQYLAEIFEGDHDAKDKEQLVRELSGYTLLQSCSYEKFVVAVGEGSNGKSVLLNLQRYLVGSEQCSAVEPHKLGDRFQRGHVRGKLANIVPELPVGAMIADDKLKSFTSGDLVTAERKGKDPFDFTPFATFWTGCNHLPHSRDLSHGMARRAIILTFNRRFEGANRDPALLAKLREELPGILASSLRALAAVFERGSFTEPASCRETLKQWMTDCDQVAQWVEAECKIGPECGPCSHAELFGRFRQWCEGENIRHSVTGASFTKRLQALGYQPDRFYLDGKQVRGFMGIEPA